MRKISLLLLFFTINICINLVQAQTTDVSGKNLKNIDTSLSFQKECKSNMQWELNDQLLPDTTQNILFQKFTPLYFGNNLLLSQKSDSLGQMPVWMPDESGSLLIKVPKDANKGFILILDPD
jgi:hypothetical protein